MRRTRRAEIVLAFGLPVVAALAYLIAFGLGPRRIPVEPAPASARHVLLITIDTLRADRVGSYGHTAARTPALDGLAQRGVRFARAYATAPVTLPSHASMMTGLYPPGHGARHNGMAMRRDVRTLAEALKTAGFETGAFVSAFPLDARFGLTRGFDTYDCEMPRGEDGRRANERAGSVTVDRAIAWARTRPASARIFAWVHLFEPHAPYGTPSSDGRDAASRYDDEIAVADREIGRLLEAWRDLSQTLIVATADHGEAFGEHGEIGHSIFVYDTTLHVPMMLAGPGVRAGTVVDGPVTVADIAPTITAFTQLPTPGAADGIDLRPAIAGQQLSTRALYAESFAPLVDFGWAALRSLRRDEVKLIAAPRPELYDLRTDGGERRNIIHERALVGTELQAQVDRISGSELRSQHARVDPDALARLRSLGYASGAAPAPGARADPKDRIAIAARIASVTSGELQGAAAERALRDVLAQDSKNPQAQQRLGFILAESGRCAEAVGHFKAAIASSLPSADPYLGLAMCQARRHETADALATLEEARRAEPGNPIVEANIGLTALELGRLDPAIAALRRALEIDADLHHARFALARALARKGQRKAALQEAVELLRRLPAGAPQRPEVNRLIATLS